MQNDGEWYLGPIPEEDMAHGSAWFQRLYERFAPARAEAEQKHYTDEEINAAIDEAVAAVRRGHAPSEGRHSEWQGTKQSPARDPAEC